MSSFMGLADASDRFLRKTCYDNATWLMQTAMKKDLSRCLWELNRGGNAHETTRFRVSLLHFAALNKDHGAEIAKYLTSQLGLSLASEDADGEEPIHYALRVGDFNVAQQLLEMRNPGCKFNLLHYCIIKNDRLFAELVHKHDGSLINQFDAGGRKALHLAAQLADHNMCRFLITVLGAHPGVLSVRHATVMHHAVQNRCHATQIIRYFHGLEGNPVDIDSRTKSGETPLHIALFLEKSNVAAELLKLGASIRKKLHGKNQLHLCVERDKLTSARFVHGLDSSQMKELNSVGKSVIHLAAERANLFLCDWLVDAGADVTARCVERGSNAMHRVGMNEKHGKGLVDFFLSLDLSLQSRDKQDLTPLHYALRRANLEVAQQMVDSGASLEVEVNRRNLLFHCIAQKNLESAQFVLGLQKKLINWRASGGRTILHLAAEYSDVLMCDWLVREGTSVYALSHKSRENVLHFSVRNVVHGPSLINYFLRYNLYLYSTNKFGMAPIHAAIECGNFSILNELLKLDVTLDPLELLCYCVIRNKLSCAKFLHERHKDLIFKLIASFDKMTLLHFSALWSRYEFCEWLISEGVDPRAMDRFCRLAWQLVPSYNTPLIHFLREKCNL